MVDNLRIERTATVVRLALIAAAMASSACEPWTGPSKSVAGTWFALGIGHSSYYELELVQDGGRISGRACGSDSGFLLFHDAPVTGKYPKLAFTGGITPATFAGKFEDDRDQIAGEYGTIPLRFNRRAGGRCAGALPLPR